MRKLREPLCECCWWFLRKVGMRPKHQKFGRCCGFQKTASECLIQSHIQQAQLLSPVRLDPSGKSTKWEPSRKELIVREEDIRLTSLVQLKYFDYWRERANTRCEPFAMLVRKLALLCISRSMNRSYNQFGIYLPSGGRSRVQEKVRLEDGCLFVLFCFYKSTLWAWTAGWPKDKD